MTAAEPQLNPSSYPSLFRSADASAASAQRTYLLLVSSQYFLLISAASISVLFDYSSDFYSLYAVVVTASTGLLLYMAVQKPEKDWYGCRALAESIKTATWRYMMRAEPFAHCAETGDARIEFSKFLRSILDANAHVHDPISRHPSIGEQITVEMERIRSLSLPERSKVYKEHRILDQRSWYIAKIAWNRRQFRFWLAVCVLVQLIVIILVILRIKYDQLWSIWPTEPLLVLASSLVGWIQLKKFNELASAYNLTAHEIAILNDNIDMVAREEDLSVFVNDAERAFSREHTQWIARQVDRQI